MKRKVFFIESLKGSIVLSVCVMVAALLNEASILYIPVIFLGMAAYFIFFGIPCLFVWYWVFKKFEFQTCKVLFTSGLLTILVGTLIVYFTEWILSSLFTFQTYGVKALVSFLVIALPGFLTSFIFVGFKIKKQHNKSLQKT